MILWVWHQAEHVAPYIADSGHVAVRPVGIARVSGGISPLIDVRDSDLPVVLQARPGRLAPSEKPTLAVSNGHVEKIRYRLGEHAWAVRIGLEVHPATFETGATIW